MKPEKQHTSRKWIVLAAVILLAGGLVYAGMSREAKVQYEWVEAKRMDLVQEVSVTGRVQSAESADLAFEVVGKVKAIEVAVGQAVKAGDPLVRLNDDDLAAQRRQAQASVQSAQAQLAQFQAALESQQAKLEELRAGTRPEEIQVAQTAVMNAQQSWEDAKRNLETVKSKAEVDLSESLNSAVTELAKAANIGKTSMLTLTDIQYAHFNTMDQDGIRLANAKALAVYVLLGAQDAGRWINNALGALTGGAYGDATAALADPTSEKVDRAIVSTLDGLRKAKAALETVPLTSVVTSAERTSLDLEKTNVNNEIIAVSAKQQAIAVQKAMNRNSVASAESQESDAKNALASARDQLALKEAGSTAEQIRGQEAQVRQAQANVSSQKATIAQAAANVQAIQARVDKTVLKTPISGVVTSQEAKVGEIVAANTVVVSIISGAFQIESDIAEVDISKVKIGDPAKVTLDAYGTSEQFGAKVVKIDPAETIVEGVPTYTATFEFDQQDERIKSGMTANLDIVTDHREKVVAIPQRAVLAKEGERSVRVLVTEASPKDSSDKIEVMKERPVRIGIRGVDGNVEILEGIEEGDKVVTAIKN